MVIAGNDKLKMTKLYFYGFTGIKIQVISGKLHTISYQDSHNS